MNWMHAKWKAFRRPDFPTAEPELVKRPPSAAGCEIAPEETVQYEEQVHL